MSGNSGGSYLPAPPPVSPLEAEFFTVSEVPKMPVSAGATYPARPPLNRSNSSSNPTSNSMPSFTPALDFSSSVHNAPDSNTVSAPGSTSASSERLNTANLYSRPGPSSAHSNTPTPSDFNDPVVNWDHLRVREWLESVKCDCYIGLFEEHHITGEVLLDCDDSILRDMGVKKVGDRIRMSQAIVRLRLKPANSPLSLNTAAHVAAGSARPQTAKLHKSLEQLNQSIVSPFDPENPSKYPRRFNTPSLLKSHSSGVVTPRSTAPTQTVTVDAHNDNVKEILSMDVVKQNTVKFIYSQGQSKTVNVGNCRDADEIKSRALKKLTPAEENPSVWCVHVADNELGTTTKKLSDSELVTICRSPDLLERKRLILCQNGLSPSLKQLSKSQQILRDSLAGELDRHSVSSKSSTSFASIFSEVGNGPMSHSSSGNPRQSSLLMDDDETGTVFPERLKKATSRVLGMQRPPSELISSNLQEFFPNTTPQVLQETVRASRRFSKRVSRLSRISSRLSVSSSTWGIPESEESIPPVPPLPVEDTGTLTPTSSGGDTITQFSSASLERKSSVGSRRNEIESNSGVISAIARRISTTSRSRGSRKSTSSDNPSIVSSEEEKKENTEEEEEKEEDEDEDMENENWGEFLDTIRREESCPTKWIKGNFIGSGSFGQVYLGMNSITGELMAIKQVELPTLADKGDESRKRAMIDALHREMSLLRVLHHPHIVQYFGSNSDKTHLNIFLEYVPGGSVSTMLANYGTFEPSLVRSFVRQILDGLDYLHKQNIIHRDIKGANILVDNKGSVKISDFGISKKIEAEFLTSNRVSLQGSVFWMAPEVVKQTSYTSKADIWSLGCLVIEMFTGVHPFPEFSQMQAIFRLGNSGSPSIPDDISPIAQDFLQQTFRIDYNKRPTAGELLQHEFIKGT